MRIALTTLGCKINQYESEQLRQDLQVRGNSIVPFDAEADVYVVNTCSVTAKSDYQCRQAIRSAARRGKDAKVVVTGCYATTRPQELRNIPGVTLVVGNQEKSALAGLITNIVPSDVRVADHTENDPFDKSPGRTRGFLKIQDGCDNRCSYCIVPFARGGSRSKTPEEVTNDFKRFVQNGCPEIVLTGIHIGAYGADLRPPTDLSTLLAALIPLRDRTRIRLSSIEPNEITPEVYNLLGGGLCRHLHIPLQSGDDSILKSMGRKYTSRYYLEIVEKISSKVSGIALGTDVMVGFPGEGDKEFQNTIDLLERSPLTHFHVFSYSPRPGTVACEMNLQVPEWVKKERSEALRNLGRKKNYDYRKKYLGSEVKVVIENKKDAQSGALTGLSDSYLRVLVPGAGNDHIGKEINVRIDRVENDLNIGVIL